MRISEYGNSLRSIDFRTQNSTKTNKTFGEKVSKTTKTANLTLMEEMGIFKQEIYNEIDKIYSNASPKLISCSLHITESAFKRLNSDFEYKEEIMNTLLEGIRSIHQFPHNSQSAITVYENGYRGFEQFIFEEDSYETKDAKIAFFAKMSEGVFYKRDFSAKASSYSGEV